MAFSNRNIVISLFLVVGLGFGSLLDLVSASGFCSSAVGHSHKSSHHCDHGHDHHRHHHHHHDHHHHHEKESLVESKLPEELAEEEDLKLYGFGSHNYDHDHEHEHEHFGVLHLTGPGLWIHALGCSLLVSMASLICLIILPVMFVQGKPSKTVVESLALFGAGAMLGDAFLHQLPHAFGGGHLHSHDHHADNDHDHAHDHGHAHSHSHLHSLADLSVGLSILAGIVLFLLVEKVVRYVEDNSRGSNAWSHGHHHLHHRKSKKLKDDNDSPDDVQSDSSNGKDGTVLEKSSEGKVTDEVSLDPSEADTQRESSIRKRHATTDGEDDREDVNAAKFSSDDIRVSKEEHAHPPTNLVFGYLNLFSDGVHNFTDGMALGSAFLLYGSVGGWSRTLFLLAHELPQEVGDFGILVRSGFSVSKALFFNFLSALVALVGTAMALLWGQDPGQSSLIEGFTAGGFIYIAVAGVLAEMNSSGKTTLKSIAAQMTSLTLGMAVALCISLVE